MKSAIYLNGHTYYNLDEREAIDLYQIEARKHEKLTVIGEGKECAFCLMLAGRFQPEEILLSPADETGNIEPFLKSVFVYKNLLFAVCAPITLYLPINTPDNDLIKIKKLLSKTSTVKYEIKYYENTKSHRLFLTNLCKIRKTLA